jgi:hypothetical protein
MPSFEQIRSLVKKAGKHTLREIERATIEKLTNKILRQFTYDIVVMMPAVLLVMLEWRQAIAEECNRQLIVWLSVYFGTMIGFCFVKLTRIPVLTQTRTLFFYYTAAVYFMYYLTLFCTFIWGNVLFWRNMKDPSCN